MHTNDSRSNQPSVALSIVIPLYNEEGNVSQLVARLIPITEELEGSTEIILVNDGSKDRTWENIAKVARHYQQVKGVCLSRNFGHQHALMAGLQLSCGRAVISMDGDLQHPPELIPEMFNLWSEGYKVVNTHRRDQEVTGLFKRLSSKYFYRLFSILTDVSMEEGSSDFRLLDKQVIDELRRFRDTDLFLRGSVQWLGFPTSSVSFDVEPRFSGTSKYNLKKMLKFAIGAIVSFSSKPLRLSIWFGVITSILAFSELIYVLIQVARNETVPGWASTTGILAFLFGILFIVLGIIGVYIARIHDALKGRPSFVIDKTENFENPQSKKQRRIRSL